MPLQHVARAVRHHVPYVQPAVANANACLNYANTRRTFHSVPDQRLLLSVTQESSSHRARGHVEVLRFNARNSHSSSGSQVRPN